MLSITFLSSCAVMFILHHFNRYCCIAGNVPQIDSQHLTYTSNPDDALGFPSLATGKCGHIHRGTWKGEHPALVTDISGG